MCPCVWERAVTEICRRHIWQPFVASSSSCWASYYFCFCYGVIFVPLFGYTYMQTFTLALYARTYTHTDTLTRTYIHIHARPQSKLIKMLPSLPLPLCLTVLCHSTQTLILYALSAHWLSFFCFFFFAVCSLLSFLFCIFDILCYRRSAKCYQSKHVANNWVLWSPMLW